MSILKTVRPDFYRSLLGVSRHQFCDLVARVHQQAPDSGRGRPWSLPLADRVALALAALHTNLDVRELASLFATSKSTVHRVLADMTRRLAGLFVPPRRDRRETWVVDGTLVPVRDHVRAAKSKNYRYSVNVQAVVRARDTTVIAVGDAWPGNRNNPICFRGEGIDELVAGQRRVLGDSMYRACAGVEPPPMRGSRVDRDHPRRRPHRRRRARVEHAFARLKDWRVLRDCRRHGEAIDHITRAVAYVHNLRLGIYT